MTQIPLKMNDSDIRISYETFLNNIIAFKKLSDDINDNWVLNGKTDEENKAYLTKKQIINHSNKIITYEYHVTYNLSYGVPMLCLNIWDSDGKALTIMDAWNYFNKTYIQDNMYSVLTQQDHPVLQKPFMVLHPCKTVEILKNFITISNNLIVSWLSSIGPAVHLNLNIEYEKLTRKE